MNSNEAFAQSLYLLSKIFDVTSLSAILIIYGVLMIIYIKTRSINQSLIYQKIFAQYFVLYITHCLIVFVFATIKFSLDLPRPYCSVDHYISVMDFRFERCLSSFPSAHTAFAMSLLLHTIYYCDKLLITVGMFIILCCVAISRVSLAMHYPADILYSLVLSLTLFYTSRYLYEKNKNGAVALIEKFIGKYFLRINDL